MDQETVASEVSMRLFGPLEVKIGGASLPTPDRRKALELLAFLAVRHGQATDREQIAEALWPGSDKQGIKSLTKALQSLTDALGTEAQWIARPPGALCLTLPDSLPDVAIFNQAVASGDIHRLERAIALYRQGELLAGMKQTWVLEERKRLRQDYLAALDALANDAEAKNDDLKAIPYLTEAMRDDPIHEARADRLINLYLRQDKPRSAIAVYEDLTRHLKETLDEPGELLKQSYERARTMSRANAATLRREQRNVPETDRPNNLRGPHSSLLGRERDIAAIIAAVNKNALITLLGPGGIGKTNLAIAVAWKMIDAFEDGAWLLDLTEVAAKNEQAVYTKVRTALKIEAPAGTGSLDAICQYLKTKKILLLLDNCEHVIEACSTFVERITNHCTGVHVLATSRRHLNVPNVHLKAAFSVKPLSAPSPTRLRKIKKNITAIVAEYDAVRLFVRSAVEAAEKVGTTFVLDSNNALDVAEICHRLDGIPYSIELAAAKSRTLDPSEIVERLSRPFVLLSDAPTRRGLRKWTLEEMIEWSYDLLSAQQRTLLMRLSVFVGGWTTDAAEAVCSDDRFAQDDVQGALTELVNQNLVTVESPGAKRRFRFLETVRHFARLQLEKEQNHPSPRTTPDSLARRHADWYLAFAQKTGPEMHTARQQEAFAGLEAEHDNLKTALLWYAEPENAPEQGLRLASELWWFWFVRGEYMTEGRKYLSNVLQRTQTAPPNLRASVLEGAGILAEKQGDSGALSLLTQSLEMYRAAENRIGIGKVLIALGNAYHSRSDFPNARMRFSEALAHFRHHNSNKGVAICMTNLGHVEFAGRHYVQALQHYEAALERLQLLPDQHDIANAEYGMGNALLESGRQDEAETLLRSSFKRFHDLKQIIPCLSVLESLAYVMAAQGLYEKAAVLIGVADAQRKITNVPIEPVDLIRHHEKVATIAEVLGEEGLIAATDRGRCYELDDAVTSIIFAVSE